MDSKRSYWLCQLLGWGFLSLLKFYAAITTFQVPWMAGTRDVLLIHGAGLVLSHGLRTYVRRHRWSELKLPALAVRIACAGVVLGIPLGVLTQLSSLSVLQDPILQMQFLNPDARRELGHFAGFFTPQMMLILQIINCAALFIIWQALYFGALAMREHRGAQLRQSELARALQTAELRLLKSQLNPHFLFNALNTVRSLISDDPARAKEAVTRLASTLRYALGAAQKEWVPLEQELKIVDDYLGLESLRFEDRLKVERHIAAEACRMHIPAMLLQTLVENAIKHGIAELPAGGTLVITASARAASLVIEVENPRPTSHGRPGGDGIGIHNAQERLRLLFGAAARLELDLSQPAVALARVQIPQQEPGPP